MTLKEMRLERGLSQAKIAKELDIPLRTWQSWELGERKCPEYVVRLIEYYLIHEKLLIQ